MADLQRDSVVLDLQFSKPSVSKKADIDTVEVPDSNPSGPHVKDMNILFCAVLGFSSLKISSRAEIPHVGFAVNMKRRF